MGPNCFYERHRLGLVQRHQNGGARPDVVFFLFRLIPLAPGSGSDADYLGHKVGLCVCRLTTIILEEAMQSHDSETWAFPTLGI